LRASRALCCRPRRLAADEELRHDSRGAPMTRLKNALYVTAAVCSVGACLLYAQSKQDAATAVTPENYAASKEWPTYGHDSGGMRFSPLTEITPANVNTLETAWVYHLKPEGYVAPVGV